MAESVKERVGEVVQQAKGAVKKDGPPVATDVEGRIQVVRDALQAFGSGDFDAFLDSMDENVEWEAPKGDNFPGATTLTGRKAIEEQFIGDVRRSYVSFGFTPGTWLESEDRDWVVVIGAFEGEGLNAQGAIEEPAVQVWEFHQGKVANIRIFADSAAFPEIVTEQQREEEDRKAAEAEQGEDRDEQQGEGSEGSGPQASESGEGKTQEEQAAEDPAKGSGDEEHDDPGARS